MLDSLERLSATGTRALVAVGVLAMVVTTALDLMAGSSVTVRGLWIVPVFLFTWALGRLAGALVATVGVSLSLAVLGWQQDDLDGIDALNAGIRLVTLLFAVMAIDLLRGLLDRERSRARRDPVTGALTRWALLEEAAQMCAAAGDDGSSITVLHIDLDRFKVLAAQSGHDGDEVLGHVVALLRAQLPPEARLGRVGGDEVVVLLPASTLPDALELAGAVRDAVLEAFGGAVRKGPNIGVAHFERPPGDPEQLLRTADELVYDARRDQEQLVAVVKPADPEG